MLVKIIVILIGIFAVLAVILALQGQVAGEWTIVGKQTAVLITFLVFFAITIAGIYDYTHGR